MSLGDDDVVVVRPSPADRLATEVLGPESLPLLNYNTEVVTSPRPHEYLRGVVVIRDGEVGR